MPPGPCLRISFLFTFNRSPHTSFLLPFNRPWEFYSFQHKYQKCSSPRVSFLYQHSTDLSNIQKHYKNKTISLKLVITKDHNLIGKPRLRFNTDRVWIPLFLSTFNRPWDFYSFQHKYKKISPQNPSPSYILPVCFQIFILWDSPTT